MEVYQFVIINEVRKNTNVNSESNILSTNKKSQLHKNIVDRNEKTEHSPIFKNM
jgi:hypothetical protein